MLRLCVVVMAEDSYLGVGQRPRSVFFRDTVLRQNRVNPFLDRDALDLIERNLVLPPVVELRRSRLSWLAMCCAASSVPLLFR